MTNKTKNTQNHDTYCLLCVPENKFDYCYSHNISQKNKTNKKLNAQPGLPSICECNEYPSSSVDQVMYSVVYKRAVFLIVEHSVTTPLLI